MPKSRKELKRLVTEFNPRASNAWSESDTKFGQRMLEKMGWKKGQGLGANNQGITENVKLRLKLDSKGLGFRFKEDEWVQVEQSFSTLLSQLNHQFDNYDSQKITPNSLESQSSSFKSRVHYHKFTRGKDVSRYNKKDLAGILGQKMEIYDENSSHRISDVSNKSKILFNDTVVITQTINEKENKHNPSKIQTDEMMNNNCNNADNSVKFDDEVITQNGTEDLYVNNRNITNTIILKTKKRKRPKIDSNEDLSEEIEISGSEISKRPKKCSHTKTIRNDLHVVYSNVGDRRVPDRSTDIEKKRKNSKKDSIQDSRETIDDWNDEGFNNEKLSSSSITADIRVSGDETSSRIDLVIQGSKHKLKQRNKNACNIEVEVENSNSKKRKKYSDEPVHSPDTTLTDAKNKKKKKKQSTVPIRIENLEYSIDDLNVNKKKKHSAILDESEMKACNMKKKKRIAEDFTSGIIDSALDAGDKLVVSIENSSKKIKQKRIYEENHEIDDGVEIHLKSSSKHKEIEVLPAVSASELNNTEKGKSKKKKSSQNVPVNIICISPKANEPSNNISSIDNSGISISDELDGDQETTKIQFCTPRKLTKAEQILEKCKLLRKIQNEEVPHNFNGSNLVSIQGYGNSPVIVK